jgi:hypothetical protein
MMRQIDHLVLPVNDLPTARGRLGALGFTVAPDANHPFGTSNACVFLADGTYLEPLAWKDEAQVRSSAKNGNQFTARDITFRAVAGENGFSALVMSSEDADADHARFQAAGACGGDILEFSRQALTSQGQAVTARFRLAFLDVMSDVFFLFCCQRLNPLPADRAALERHDNGVVALREIVLASVDCGRYAPSLELVSGQAAEADGDDCVFVLPNGRVRLTSAQSETLSGRMLVFQSADLSVTEHRLAANGIAFEKRDARIVVSPAPGQGVAFAFED